MCGGGSYTECTNFLYSKAAALESGELLFTRYVQPLYMYIVSCTSHLQSLALERVGCVLWGGGGGGGAGYIDISISNA